MEGNNYLIDNMNGLGKSALALAIGVDLMKNDFYKDYQKKKERMFIKLKGGKNQMETKSRYEVIADLETKKRDLIVSRDGLNDSLRTMERSLRDLKREVEDQEEEIKNFKDNKTEQEKTYNELIKSVDESLKRMNELNKK